MTQKNEKKLPKKNADAREHLVRQINRVIAGYATNDAVAALNIITGAIVAEIIGDDVDECEAFIEAQSKDLRISIAVASSAGRG